MATFAAMNEFSLLMSVYNGEKAKHLTECFDSIYQQTLKPTEIVLVEDGPLSPDLYAAIDREQQRFPNLKRIPLPQNQGLGKALNRGMEACSHSIVARMDTDDICTPKRFEVQLRFMQQHPDIDVLSAWISEFDDVPTNVIGIRNIPENHDDIFRFGKKRNPINHPVAMFRREAVVKAGGYQPMPLFEDYYLWARMLQQGYRFHNLQQPLLLFRRSPQMMHRRGGLAYTRHEIHFFRQLHRIGYISYPVILRNIFVRFLIRLLPNSLRSVIYSRMLRTNP